MQATHPGPTGKLSIFQFSLRPSYDEKGAVCYLVSEARDVTQETLFQEVLGESELRFRLAFESAGLGMALVALDGKWMQVNSALCQILGYSESELLGTAAQEITHPGDLEADLSQVRHLLEGTSTSYQMEKRYYHKNGAIIWTFTTISLVRSLAGEAQYFISQIQDDSVRKRAQEELKESLAEKEVMLQEIHHRVKNNLQVIVSLIQLQSYQLSDPDLVDAMRDCQSRIHSMSLVHDRLYKSGSFARLDFGEHLRDLTLLVASAQTAGGSHVQLEFQLQAVEISMEIAIPLGLIANELVSNAFKHAFRGRPQGHLRVALTCLAQDELCLEVSDDGPGLPQDFQLSNTASTLGLRLITTLTRQIRGQLSVGRSPTLGGGQFCVKLRLAQPLGQVQPLSPGAHPSE